MLLLGEREGKNTSEHNVNLKKDSLDQIHIYIDIRMLIELVELLKNEFIQKTSPPEMLGAIAVLDRISFNLLLLTSSVL